MTSDAAASTHNGEKPTAKMLATLQHIAGELARGQLLDRGHLVLIDVAHIANPLDQDAQQAIDGHLIELGLS